MERAREWQAGGQGISVFPNFVKSASQSSLRNLVTAP